MKEGIVIHDANDNIISANMIGTDAFGMAELGNGGSGVMLSSAAQRNLIENNVISGNQKHGVDIWQILTNDNVLVGNIIGTNAAGNAALRHSRCDRAHESPAHVR